MLVKAKRMYYRLQLHTRAFAEWAGLARFSMLVLAVVCAAMALLALAAILGWSVPTAMIVMAAASVILGGIMGHVLYYGSDQGLRERERKVGMELAERAESDLGAVGASTVVSTTVGVRHKRGRLIAGPTQGEGDEVSAKPPMRRWLPELTCVPPQQAATSPSEGNRVDDESVAPERVPLLQAGLGNMPGGAAPTTFHVPPAPSPAERARKWASGDVPKSKTRKQLIGHVRWWSGFQLVVVVVIMILIGISIGRGQWPSTFLAGALSLAFPLLAFIAINAWRLRRWAILCEALLFTGASLWNVTMVTMALASVGHPVTAGLDDVRAYVGKAFIYTTLSIFLACQFFRAFNADLRSSPAPGGEKGILENTIDGVS